MGARTRRFTSLATGSGKATAVVVCAAAMILAGCGGSGESATDAGAPVIRGSVDDECEKAKEWEIPTAAVGGVTRTVVFTAPTYTSPWTQFTATANTGQSATISTSASSGSIQVRGLTKKANNTFIVTGTTANGCTYTSPPSITVSGVVEAVAAPGVPTISTLTAGDAKVTVTVAAATTGGTPASYAVTASPAVTGGACTVTGESGSCDVTGLTNGTAYTFTATATNAGGTSAASAPSAPVTPVTVPGAPTIGAVAAAGSTSATVAFTLPASNGGSVITKYTATSAPGGFTGTLSQAGSGQITVAGLTAGTPYTFTVTATNAAGTSAPSAPSAPVTILGPPGVPGIGAVAAAGPTSATVAFTLPASNGGSAITRYTATSNTGSLTGTVSQAGSGTITVNGLTANTPYTFTVTATNAKGTSAPSDPSTSVTPKPPTPVTAPAAPAKPTVVAGNGKVTVTVAAGATGGTPASYTVTGYTASSVAAGTCTVTGASGSCDVTGLTSGTAYTFKATATNSAGTSAASLASASVNVLGVPGTPGIGAVIATGSTTARVKFTVPSRDGGSPITQYTVTSIPSGGSGSGSGIITVTGLTPGTAYKFTVAATNAVGTSAPSAESASVTTASAPMDYAFGSTGPAGGKIVYVSASGFTSTGSACGTSCHYLEVAPGPWTKVNWCNLTTTTIPGVFGTSIGSGFENTRLMTTGGCTSGAGSLARATTRTVNGMTFSDWFLPSKDELQAVVEGGGASSVDYYWTSSQTAAQFVWRILAAFQAIGNGNKADGQSFALPVRAF